MRSWATAASRSCATTPSRCYPRHTARPSTGCRARRQGLASRDPGTARRPLAAVGAGTVAGAAGHRHHRVQACRTRLREGALGMAQGILASSTTPGQPDPQQALEPVGRPRQPVVDGPIALQVDNLGVEYNLRFTKKTKLRTSFVNILHRREGRPEASGPCEAPRSRSSRGESVGSSAPTGRARARCCWSWPASSRHPRARWRSTATSPPCSASRPASTRSSPATTTSRWPAR